MFATSRLIVLCGAGLLFLIGVVAVAEGGAAAFLPGAGLMIAGGLGIAAALFERTRYRSSAAERAGESPGPGGGERRDELQARFQRTEEVFRDPTTGHRMRVFLDPRTGERRYVAED